MGLRMEIEEWKDIENYEGLYQISSLGRVKSLRFHGSNSHTSILKPKKNWKGYLYVNLCKGGTKKQYSVHRLVACAFIPNPQNLATVNHKNEIKTDNRVENIEWLSCKDNINHGTGVSRRAKTQAKSYDQFTPDGVFVRRFTGSSELREHGFNQSGVWQCCHNRLATYRGYIWKYA